jgi:hypothetical protein
MDAIGAVLDLHAAISRVQRSRLEKLMNRERLGQRRPSRRYSPACVAKRRRFRYKRASRGPPAGNVPT